MVNGVSAFTAFCLVFSTFVSVSRCECPPGYEGSPCVDVQPPVCDFCPADIVQEAEDAAVRVDWDRPNCTDNSEVQPAIYSNRQSGAYFSVPGSYLIQYWVSDGVNEYTGCSFTVTLKVKTCPSLTAPQNGALACTTSSDPVCAVLCQSGTDFEFNPPLLYFCSGAEWSFYALNGQPFDEKTPGPNSVCSDSAKSWIFDSPLSSSYYYSGDAHDSSVQEAIQSMFHSFLRSVYVPPVFCLPGSECTEDSISVSPGVIG